MIKEKGLVKIDTNFLTYPGYMVDDRSSSVVYEYPTRNGVYRMATAAEKFPNRQDYALLYYLLKRYWERSAVSRMIRVSRYQVTTELYGQASGATYKRFKYSLERLMKVSMEFKGNFYTGDSYSERGFHIIEGYHFCQDNKVEIWLDEQFWLQWVKLDYYRKIDWRVFARFKRNLTARLYEVFKGTRLPLKMTMKSLKNKLTLTERFPSDINRLLRPAFKELNRVTELNYGFNFFSAEGDYLWEFYRKKTEFIDKSVKEEFDQGVLAGKDPSVNNEVLALQKDRQIGLQETIDAYKRGERV